MTKSDINSKKGTLAAFISIVANVLLFAVKFWIGITVKSVALMADAWHTLSDSFTSVVVIAGLKLSRKPADEEHPFGHGRIELISSIIVAVLLALVGVNFIKEAVLKLIHRETTIFTLSAIIITAVSVVVKEGMAQYTFRVAKKIDSGALKADSWHHRSDAISSIVILAGIFLGKRFWWIDSVLGFAVSLFLVYTAISIMREASGPLIGEKVTEKMKQDIAKVLKEIFRRDVTPHHFHIHRYGLHREITFHVNVPPQMSVDEAHHLCDRTEKKIDADLGLTATVHIEPTTDGLD